MSNPFKVGDKVRVVRPHHYLKEKEFIVDGCDNLYVHLVGVVGGYDYDRFKLVEPKGQAGGLKYDAGKTQWSLLMSAKGMLAAVTGVVGVLMFGAKKYAAHSWREVEDNERRYLDGLMRHYTAIMEHGLTAVDAESGLLHIDHLNCNGLFLAEIARANANKVE